MATMDPLIFGSLRHYQRRSLVPDVVAGLSLWGVVVPEALAYATIAGVSPVVGLYAVAPAALLYAMFGSSRHLVVGPMSATAVLSAAVVAPLAKSSGENVAALTAAFAIVCGVVALAAGLLRLGFIAGLISAPVLKGFNIGMALQIIMGQIPKLLGVDKGSGDFFQQALAVVKEVPKASWATFAVGAVCLVALLAIRRFWPRLPSSLIIVVVAIGASQLLGLGDAGVDLVGKVDGGLPHIGLPDAPLSSYVVMLGAGAGAAVVAFAQGLGAAKQYSVPNGYEIDANRELVGLGAANIASGLCSGMVVNGSLTKTAVNAEAGAKTQLSGLVAAALTLLTLAFLTPLFAGLPEATLAAIVIVAVIDLVDIKSLRRFYHLWTTRLGAIYGPSARADFIAALAATLGVLVFNTLPGLLIGILVSLILLLYRSSKPNIARLGKLGDEWVDVSRSPEASEVPGVIVLRIEGPLVFASSEAVRAGILNAIGDGDNGLVLDAETVPMVDLTAAQSLEQLGQELAERGIHFVVASTVGQVRDIVRVADKSAPFQQAKTIDDAVAQVSQASGGGKS